MAWSPTITTNPQSQAPKKRNMISDVAMSDYGAHETNKRAIEVANGADERSIKRVSTSTTFDDAMAETTQMSDERTCRTFPAFGDLKIVLQSRHDTPVQVEDKRKQSDEAGNAKEENEKLYIAGLHLGGGWPALAPHLFAPYADETTEPSVAERRAEVLAIIGAMLASVDETTARLTRQSTAMRSSMTFDRDDVREKLTYILEARW